jgi:hypothetical protein
MRPVPKVVPRPARTRQKRSAAPAAAHPIPLGARPPLGGSPATRSTYTSRLEQKARFSNRRALAAPEIERPARQPIGDLGHRQHVEHGQGDPRPRACRRVVVLERPTPFRRRADLDHPGILPGLRRGGRSSSNADLYEYPKVGLGPAATARAGHQTCAIRGLSASMRSRPPASSRPHVMAMLGARAWWLPGWLDRLIPNVDLEGAGLEHPQPRPSPSAGPAVGPEAG